MENVIDCGHSVLLDVTVIHVEIMRT